MKKLFLLLALATAIVSCKNTEDKKADLNTAEAAVNIKTFSGEFLYLADAAVLKGNNFIYGVTIDEMMHKLADQVQSIKNDDYDMVPVIVKGSLTKKTEGSEGWEEIITITEIVNVSDTPSEADIKIEEKKS